MNEPPTPRNAELRRALVKLFVVITAGLLLMLTLVASKFTAGHLGS
jgi:hypothetical protein